MSTISSKPTWYVEITKWLSRYQQYLRKLDSLKEEAENLQPHITTNYSIAPTKSGLRDDTLDSAGKRITNEVEQWAYSRECRTIDRLLETFSLEQQFIMQKRFIEGKKDSEVIKLYEKEFGVLSEYKYRKQRDKVVRDMAKVFGLKGCD